MIKLHLLLPDFIEPERNGLFLGSVWCPIRRWRSYIHAWLKLPLGAALPLDFLLTVEQLRELALPGYLPVHVSALPF